MKTESVPAPLKPEGEPMFRILDRPFVDRFIEIFREIGCFEKKALRAMGHHGDTISRWKRVAREYQHELDETGADADRRDPRYPALYLLRRIEQARLEEKGILWASAKEQALGRAPKFKLDEQGEIQLDGTGRPIVLEEPLAPNFQATKYLLGVMDRDYAPRTRHTVGFGGDASEDEEGIPTALEVHVVDSRPDPDPSELDGGPSEE